MSQANDYLSPQEAADLLQVSRNTVLRWIDAGHIKGYRTFGGHRRIMKSELQQVAARFGIPCPGTVTAAGGLSPAIVAVDDNHDFLFTLEMTVKDAFPEVPFHGAEDAFTAGAVMQKVKPRVLLLDLEMPGMDGAVICAKLRADDEYAGIRIAALTAHADNPMYADAFLAAGGERVFPKPFDRTELTAFLAGALGVIPARH